MARSSRSAAARGRRSSGPGPGGIPPWLPLAVLLSGALVGGRALLRHAEQRGVGIVDTSRYRLHERGAYTSPAWQDRIARVLASTRGTLAADDPEAVAEFCAALAGLSFVEAVGTPEVVWPDGLTVPLLYKEPVACVRVEDVFLPVDREGQVLLGKSFVPHEAYGASLPMVGRPEYTLEFVRPGDRLTDPAFAAGFEVAASLWEHLDSEHVALLGRMVIDASRDTAPDGLPGGVVIDLEDRRRILFGRPPLGPLAQGDDRAGISPELSAELTAELTKGRAGELPLALKWRNIAAAAEALRDGTDWVLFDARWDVPELILRGSDLDRTLAAYAGGE